MSELRFDPVRGSWVIIASERSRRPSDFKSPPYQGKGEINCPFCPGNEKGTPPEVFAFRARGSRPDTPGWQVRVIPNKFASLAPEDGTITVSNSLFQTRQGSGVHEVVIEGPAHNTFFPDLQPDHAFLVLQSWRQRYLQLQHDDRLQYIQLFKNYGRAAGASLEHPHSQLIATPVLPPAVKHLINQAKNYWQAKN